MKDLDASDLDIRKHVNGSDIRFTATQGDHPDLEAELDLKGAGKGRYAATHTGVPPEMGGRGVGTALFHAMVADARKSGYSVLPVCPFIMAKFDKEPDMRDVMAA